MFWVVRIFRKFTVVLKAMDHLMKIVTKVLNSFIQFLMLISVESIDNFDKGICLFECLGC